MSKTDDANETVDSERRNIFGVMLGAMAAATVGGCTGGRREDLGLAMGALASGSNVKWVETVIGSEPVQAAPPALLRTTGDLGTMSGVDLDPTWNPTVHPEGTVVALASGCRTRGDGGGGMFMWRTGTAVDDGGTIIVPSSNPAPVGYWQRIYSGPVDVRWFGAVGDNAPHTDRSNDHAFSNAIESYFFTSPPFVFVDGDVNAPGNAVYVSPGVYHLESSLVIDKQTRLFGATGSGRHASSVLVFRPNVPVTDQPHGIIIHRDLSASPTNPNNTQGDWTHVSDLHIRCRALVEGEVSTSGHGILMNARATIERCLVSAFRGDGIHIEGNCTSAAGTNCNNWSVRDVRVETCGGNGLTLEGTCANAGTCIGLDVSFNGGWGISDNSEVGNTFIGCHADQNNLGAYQTTLISTRSIFLGCYVEAPGNPGAKFESHVQPPSIMFGGFASDSQRGAGSTMYCDTDGKLLLKQGAVGLLRAASGAVASAWIGGPQAEALNALGFAASDGSPNDAHPYYLQYNRATGWWDLTYDGSPPPLRLGTHTSDGTAEGGKQIWFPNGFYVGGGAAHGGYPVKIGTDVHHPTDPGEQHEIRFYSYPGPAAVLLPGHPVGWVCTEVGTWRPFGAILPGV